MLSKVKIIFLIQRYCHCKEGHIGKSIILLSDCFCLKIQLLQHTALSGSHVLIDAGALITGLENLQVAEELQRVHAVNADSVVSCLSGYSYLNT